MRAFAMTDFDAVPALIDLEVPEPAGGEVRVRVRAASVNGFDLAVAAGHTKDYMEHRFPLVLGKDFAGEVDAVGTGVTDYVVGDRVFGTVTKPYLGDGSFAEYVTVPTAIGIAKLPENVSFTEGPASAWPARRHAASSTPPRWSLGRPCWWPAPPAASAPRLSNWRQRPVPG